MTSHLHKMLRDFDHDKKALQDFVTSFRAHLAGKDQARSSRGL